MLNSCERYFLQYSIKMQRHRSLTLVEKISERLTEIGSKKRVNLSNTQPEFKRLPRNTGVFFKRLPKGTLPPSKVEQREIIPPISWQWIFEVTMIQRQNQLLFCQWDARTVVSMQSYNQTHKSMHHYLIDKVWMVSVTSYGQRLNTSVRTKGCSPAFWALFIGKLLREKTRIKDKNKSFQSFHPVYQNTRAIQYGR